MKNILITGTSSGLGLSLTRHLEKKYNVYKLNKTNLENDPFDISCDLSDFGSVREALSQLPDDITCFSYVILNAGILGNLKPISDLSLDEFQNSMNINFLSNKIIIDYLLSKFKVDTIIGISSGASQTPYHGWSLYCCSKSAFRQLLGVYAYEKKETKFYSITAGPFKSKMQDYICDQDENEIPSVKKFKENQEKFPNSDKVASDIINFFPILQKYNSGTYIDLRKK